MDNVQFDEAASTTRVAAAPKGLIGFLIHNGLAKDEKGANLVLLLVAVLAIAGAAFLLMGTAPQGGAPITPSEQERMEKMTPLRHS